MDLAEEEIQQTQRIAGWLNRRYRNEDLLGHLYETLLKLKEQDSEKVHKLEYQRSCLIYAGIKHIKRDRLFPSKVTVVSLDAETGIDVADNRVHELLDEWKLTEPEHRLVDLLLEGRTKRECAAILGITVRVLDTKIKHLRVKLKGIKEQ